MSLSYAHGAIRWLAADAVSTTYTVSGLSFQPKALRFTANGLDSAGTDVVSGAISGCRSIGFAVSPSSRRSVITWNTLGSSSSDCGSVAADDCVIGTIWGTANRVGEVDLNSITSDGFTLIVDDQGTQDTTIFWEAWGGTDITVAAVGDIAEPAATGNQDYTVTGFVSAATDQVVMFAGVQSVSALNTGEGQDSGLHIGYATSGAAADNITMCGNADDTSATMDTDGYCKTGECLSMIVVGGGTAVDASATLTQFGTNNFRLNWTARALTNRRSIFLAIKGGSWKAGAYTIDGSTTSATATVSGLAFAPVGIDVIGRLSIESTAVTAVAQDRMAWGCGTSTTDRRSMGYLDEHNTANVEMDVSIQYDQVLAFASAAGTLGSIYDIAAMNSDGFQIVVDTAGGVASEWHGYLAFGNAAAGGAALAGNAAAVAAATGALTTGIQIAGASIVTTTATGSLTTGIPLAGNAAAVSLAGGVLTAQIRLTGAALSKALAAGALSTGIRLAGDAAAAATATGTLAAPIALAGDAIDQASASGALTTQIRLSGAALAQVLATGDLTAGAGGAQLAGDAAVSASGSGTLTTAIKLAGAASAIAIATGGLVTGIPLIGASASVSSATGDLTISITLSGAALAQAAASGSLSAQILLDGAALASALATGTLGGGGIIYARRGYIAALLARNFAVAPAVATKSPLIIIHSGTAQAGASKSLTLNTLASEIADAYKYRQARITGGTGAGQQRNVVSSRKNWAKYSEAFGNVYWGQPTNNPGVMVITKVDNDDGVAEKYTVTTWTTGQQSICVSRGSITSANNAVFSVEAKYGSGMLQMTVWDAVTQVYVTRTNFNLQTGATNSQQNTATVHVDAAFVEFLADGYVRCSVAISNPTGLPLHWRPCQFAASINSYGFDNTTGMYLWLRAAQLIEGDTAPSEYIHTEANAAVGIAVDVPWTIVPDATSVYEIHEILARSRDYATDVNFNRNYEVTT